MNVQKGLFIFEMKISWDDLKLFLDVARMGGLSAAGRTNGLSPATLGRRVTALEKQIGEPLFTRLRTGYRLTGVGEELLTHAGEVEAGFKSIDRWHQGRHGERVVRISAGYWTSGFLARNIGALWQPKDRFRVEFVTANEKVDIGRRHADLGLRNARPTEQWLAGRRVSHITFALYSGCELISDVAAGMFVGLSGGLTTPSARWLEAHHGDRIGVHGNDPASIRELVIAGAGLGVFPCFIGDNDPSLIRVGNLISELTCEQWLVSHHDERHNTHVRKLGDRIASLVKTNRELFQGNAPTPSPERGA